MKILEIALGLIVIYFLYSLLVSILAEMASNWVGMRSRLLRQGVDNILNDKKPTEQAFNWLQFITLNSDALKFDFSKWWRDIFMIEPRDFKYSKAGAFYNEPSIKYLAKVGENVWYNWRHTKPAYITKENFTDTLLNMLSKAGKGVNQWQKIKFAIEHNSLHLQPDTHQMLQDWLSRTNDDYQAFIDQIEFSFEEMMARVNGWYKRKIGLIIGLLGFVLVVINNVDTIAIVKKINTDSQARASLVSLGQKLNQSEILQTKPVNTNGLKLQYDSLKTYIEDSNLLLGLAWPYPKTTVSFSEKTKFVLGQLLPNSSKLWGLIITALALSLGAQFWFDLLKKLIAIRSVGLKPTEEYKPGVQPIVKPRRQTDGLALTTQNPIEIALANNLPQWEKLKGFLAANSSWDNINKAHLELVFEANCIPALPSKIQVMVNDTLHKIPIKIKAGQKGNLGDSTSNVPNGALVQTHTQAWGSIAGKVLNKRTQKTALLTCGHVVRNDKSGFLDMNLAKINIKTSQGQEEIGLASNVVMSVFCDAGVVDVFKPTSDGIKQIPNLKKGRKVTESEEGITKVKVNGINGSTKGTLVTVNKYYTFNDTNSKDIKYYELLMLGHEESNYTQILSKPGDSGALVTDDNDTPIGILVGGAVVEGQNFSFAIKISDIMDIMQLDYLS